MFHTGLVSISFRGNTVEELIQVAKNTSISAMEWGNSENYDITVKSNRYGVDRTAAILIQLIKEFRLIQF